MQRIWCALALAGSWIVAGAVHAHAQPPVSIEIVGPDGHVFREFPVRSRDGAQRSYLEAQKGARYQVRVRNSGGLRLGLVIAVDGRNIIDGKKSELARTEPMYVLDPWATQEYVGWRANLESVNEFYFTDWADSYAEAFGDRSARGVIAVAVYPEVPPPAPARQPYLEDDRVARESAPEPPPPVAGASADRAAEKSAASRAQRDESAGTGYGDRRVDRAYAVEFVAQSDPQSRHFIKYEWRETLCRKHVVDCGEQNRFWDESALGFAPPPPRRR